MLAADRSKDLFLAAVSHELRAPPQAILGWIARIQGGTLDADIVELHDGTISTSSPGLGQGASFRIQLPRSPQ